MKNLLFLWVLMFFVSGVYSQEPESISLNSPDKTRGVSVMQALSVRKSTRIFAGKKLSLQDLSDLLWAANGINRPETGQRTAPSSMNAQDIDIYVCLPEAAYVYEPASHRLLWVNTGDFRSLVAAGQDFAAGAPVCLVLVSDISRFRGENQQEKMMSGAYDAGIVSQNINLFCAATSLVTVVRGTMDQDKLRLALKLKDTQFPLLNNPVGYPVE